ncbi:MAG: helix-turn-helix domain-containing protein [Specibacter sp.]
MDIRITASPVSMGRLSMSKQIATIHSPADLGMALQQARLAAGMSQRELSARTGVTQSAISNLESESYTLYAERLFKLLRECGVTITAEWDDSAEPVPGAESGGSQ